MRDDDALTEFQSKIILISNTMKIRNISFFIDRETYTSAIWVIKKKKEAQIIKDPIMQAHQS